MGEDKMNKNLNRCEQPINKMTALSYAKGTTYKINLTLGKIQTSSPKNFDLIVKK